MGVDRFDDLARPLNAVDRRRSRLFGHAPGCRFLPLRLRPLLAPDESVVSTVEYSTVWLYTSDDSPERMPPGRALIYPTLPRHGCHHLARASASDMP